MEERSGPNLIDLLGIQTKFARDLTGVFRNTHRMARCVRVSCFNSLYHQLEKLSVDTFYLKVHLVHMTNEEQRQDKHREPYDLQPCEKEGEHNRERTRNEII